MVLFHHHIDNAILEEGQSKHSVMHDMSHQNQFQIHKALMESYDPQSAPMIEQLVKNFYTSKYLYLGCNNIIAFKRNWCPYKLQ